MENEALPFKLFWKCGGLDSIKFLKYRTHYDESYLSFSLFAITKKKKNEIVKSQSERAKVEEKVLRNLSQFFLRMTLLNITKTRKYLNVSLEWIKTTT